MAASRRRRFRKARRNSGTLPGRPKTGRPPGVPWKTNPGGLVDMAMFVGTSFGGFAATKASSRIVGSAIARKWPRFAKHAAALTAVAAAGAAYFFGHKVKALAKYQTPIVAGAGIAAAQTLIQTYIPKWGWLISNPAEDARLPASASQGLQASGSDAGDDQWFTYNDAFDAGRYADETEALPSAQQRAEATPGTDDLDDLMAELDDGGMGVFN